MLLTRVVHSGTIASGQVGNRHLASGAVGSGHVANVAVNSGNIASGAISANHLASGLVISGTVYIGLTSGVVQSGHVGNAAVVSGNIASGSVGQAHTASGVVNYNGGFYFKQGSQYFGPIYEITPPVNADFVWLNQGEATLDATTFGGVLLTDSTVGVGAALHIRKKVAPATPYTISTLVHVTGAPNNYWTAGLCWRNSGTGQIITFGLLFSSGFATLNQTNYDSVSGINAHVTEMKRADIGIGGNVWLQLVDDGISRLTNYGLDGRVWQPFGNELRGAFITNPSEVGFYINSANSKTTKLNLLSWKETA